MWFIGLLFKLSQFAYYFLSGNEILLDLELINPALFSKIEYYQEVLHNQCRFISNSISIRYGQ